MNYIVRRKIITYQLSVIGYGPTETQQYVFLGVGSCRSSPLVAALQVSKKSFFYQFQSENNLTWLKMMGESSSSAKKSEFLVNLDRFSKFLKYFKYIEKRSKLTQNSDFFAFGECATLYHHFEPSQVILRLKLIEKLFFTHSSLRLECSY